jgi:hypothetical protein
VKFKNPGPGVDTGHFTISNVDTSNRTYTLTLDSDETVVMEDVNENDIEAVD